MKFASFSAHTLPHVHAQRGRAPRACVALALLLSACAGNLAGTSLDEAGGTGNAPVTPGVFQARVTTGPLKMRHLLRRELMASYQALLGATPSVDWSAVAPDLGGVSFDNDIAAQSVNTALVEGYLQVANQAAGDVVTAARAQALLGCSASNVDKTCMTAFIKTFGLRCFRRPLTADEVTAFMALWSSESVALDGARQVVAAFLSSPDFLWQPELGEAAPEKPGYVRLTGFERATRLSLLLTGSVPSAALLAKAQAGALDTAEGVSAEAAAMLQSAQAQAYLRWFAINWLNVNASVGTAVNPRPLANDSVQLRQDLAEETLRLFDDFAKPGANLLGIFTADYTYVTPSIAPIYGVPAPAQGQWSRVSLQGKPRLGFLTQPNILLVSNGSGPLAVGRGKFVRLRLLCQSVGSPPSSIANLELSMNSNMQTERQAMKEHLTNPTCRGCHQQMDPIGFGFEQYDGLGNYTSRAPSGDALTGIGEVVGADGFTFTGAQELSNKLAKMPQVQACVAQKLAEYVLGHTADDEDAGTVNNLNTLLASGSLVDAVVGYTRSDAFLYRQQTP